MMECCHNWVQEITAELFNHFASYQSVHVMALRVNLTFGFFSDVFEESKEEEPGHAYHPMDLSYETFIQGDLAPTTPMFVPSEE